MGSVMQQMVESTRPMLEQLKTATGTISRYRVLVPTNAAPLAIEGCKVEIRDEQADG